VDWCKFVGNGFIFADENGFEPVGFGTKVFVGAVNGFMFPPVGNGFITVGLAKGNGFVPEFGVA